MIIINGLEQLSSIRLRVNATDSCAPCGWVTVLQSTTNIGISTAFYRTAAAGEEALASAAFGTFPHHSRV